MAAASLHAPARAAGSLDIDDVFPAALPAYVTGGVKGGGGDPRNGTVFPVSTGIYVDGTPSSLAYAVRASPLVPDFDMTIRFMLAGRDGAAPEKVVFALEVQEPRYPVTCCTGDSSQIHARSGLWLVYDLGASIWSLYQEQDYVTAATPLASTTRFIPFSVTHELRVVLASGSVDVFVDGSPLLAAATGALPPGLVGLMSTRVDLIVYSLALHLDCSDPTLPDTEGDGIADSCDNCPETPNPIQQDADADGLGDACDGCPQDPMDDADQDGLCGDVDNCALVANPDQGDSDHDGEGDVCDLNDGIPHLTLPASQRVEWQMDVVYDSFNLYVGDLGVLKSQGLYTQAPFSNPVARRYCNMKSYYLYPGGTPAPGQIIFYLVSGNSNLVEGSLGTDSSGSERPNANPCEHPHPIISINGDAAFTAANGVTGGSGTAADPYLIEGWLVDTSQGASYGIGILNTTKPFVIRGVHVRGGAIVQPPTYFGIYFHNVANGRVEDSLISSIEFVGVDIVASHDVVLDGNTILGRSTGVRVESSNQVTVANNEISNASNYGIELTGTTGSALYHNSLQYNRSFMGLQAYDDSGANVWDAGYPAGGNYWTDYFGPDACGGPAQDVCTGPDGMGDTPFYLSLSTSDRYPLMVKPGAAGDLTPPSLSLQSPVDGSVTTAQTIDVSGSAADGESGLRRVEARLDGGVWAIASGTQSWFLSLTLTPGIHLVEARTIDHAGNLSAVASATVTYVVPQMEVTVLTDRPDYPPSITIGLTVTVKNLTAYPVTLHFLDFCQASFRVETPGGAVLYDWSQHATCIFELSQLTLQSGQSQSTTFTWDQRNDAGVQVPQPAYYVIRGYIPSDEPVPTGTTQIRIGAV